MIRNKIQCNVIFLKSFFNDFLNSTDYFITTFVTDGKVDIYNRIIGLSPKLLHYTIADVAWKTIPFADMMQARTLLYCPCEKSIIIKLSSKKLDNIINKILASFPVFSRPCPESKKFDPSLARIFDNLFHPFKRAR